MANEPENLVDAGKKHNRSSAPSPTQLAEATAQTNAAVEETVAATVKAIFAQLTPILERNSITPEVIAALKAPYIDPAQEARRAREHKETLATMAQERLAAQKKKDRCRHRDQNDKSSICLVHNHPDRQVRGVCVLCNDIIHPREWVVDAPDPKTGDIRQHIRDAHKDYAQVLHVASFQGVEV
jgi:hypothetical protein